MTDKRPDRKTQRQKEAKTRQTRWDAMSPEERKAAKEAKGYHYAPLMGIK